MALDISSAVLALTGLLAAAAAIAFFTLCIRTTLSTHDAGSIHRHTSHTGSGNDRRSRRASSPLSFALDHRRPVSLALDGHPLSHAVTSPLLIPVLIKPVNKSKPPTLSTKKSSLLLTHSRYLTPQSLASLIALAPPVIVTLTTLPSRVHHIDKCLTSLKLQSFPIMKILLCLPHYNDREQCHYSLPDRISRDSMIEIVRCDRDYGAATRIIEACRHPLCASTATANTNIDNDSLLVVVDDDIIYDSDFIACLVRHSLIYTESALGYAGYTMIGEPYVTSQVVYARRSDESIIHRSRRDSGANSDESGFSDSDDDIVSFPHNHSNGFESSHLYALHREGQGGHESGLLNHSSVNSSSLPPLYHTDSVDVLQSFRGLCLRPRWLAALSEMFDSLPPSSLTVDDGVVSGYLSSAGINRRVLIAPFDVILGRLKLKNGRQSGGGVNPALMAWNYASVMETIIARGWFPNHTLSDESLSGAVEQRALSAMAVGKLAESDDLKHNN